MTYNFDRGKWYENERAALEGRYRAGRKKDAAFVKALEDLDRRYEEMWRRLDGHFQIPD
jgi:hypothetical protein